MTAQQLAGTSARDESCARRRALAVLLSTAPDPAIAIDTQGSVVYANAASETLFGATAAELVGAPLASLFADPLEVERALDSLGVGDRFCNLEMTLRHRDGRAINVSVSGTRLADERAEGVVLYLRDLSERFRSEAELKRKNDELEHCVQALAHDLRSPLVALLGFSRLLRQDYGSLFDETGLHFLDRIEQAGRTMEDLIHDLLELSRISQPGERRRWVEPRAVLLQVQAEFKPRLDAQGIRLELPENPPLVFCDRTRLYQLFSNLVGNAIDHMGPGVDPHIQVEVVVEPGSHRLCVRDSGRGIDPEHHDRIFEVFQSLGPHSDGRRGTGIGLAIVRKIAETHGGRAWVDSRPGEGAAFHVRIPSGSTEPS